MSTQRVRRSARLKPSSESPLLSKENISSTHTVRPTKKRKKEVIGDASEISIKKKKSHQKNPAVEVVPSKIKTIKFNKVVPVDEECVKCKNNFHVYVSGQTVYNAMLNQTNIGQNNNKYYLLQLLKHNDKAEYCVWFRWGRIGKTAGTNLQTLLLDDAIEVFEKKFKDKTNNVWEERHSFTKYSHKYDLLQMDYGDNKMPEKLSEPKKLIASKLDKRIQCVMQLIFNRTEFEECVKEMKYDVVKAPLGKLTKKQIKAGYSSLKKIELGIKKGEFGSAMMNACNEFYTRIPHDFGMKRPPLIRYPHEIKEKLQLLEALDDIQIAISIMNKESVSNENPLDSHYKSLQCELMPLCKNEDYKLIQMCIENTHAPTHNNYKLQIENIFELHKSEHDNGFRMELENRMLLWHGSRLTNWCGILQQGVRIAPPEAPSTGFMFGKGIYFADSVSKSANYCFATPRQPLGFLLLCEVALGNMNEKQVADYEADNLPPGKHSTKGVGKSCPENIKTMSDGTLIPTGKLIGNALAKNSALLYNEYVVYNVNQVKLRYLVEVKFTFTKGW